MRDQAPECDWAEVMHCTVDPRQGGAGLVWLRAKMAERSCLAGVPKYPVGARARESGARLVAWFVRSWGDDVRGASLGGWGDEAGCVRVWVWRKGVCS